jgi:hypothetical protein
VVVIAGYCEDAEWRGQRAECAERRRVVRRPSVGEIAGERDDVRTRIHQQLDRAPQRRAPGQPARVQVAQQTDAQPFQLGWQPAHVHARPRQLDEPRLDQRGVSEDRARGATRDRQRPPAWLHQRLAPRPVGANTSPV